MLLILMPQARYTMTHFSQLACTSESKWDLQLVIKRYVKYKTAYQVRHNNLAKRLDILTCFTVLDQFTPAVLERK